MAGDNDRRAPAGGVRWDTAAMRELRCDVARARATPAAVELHLGVSGPAPEQPGATGVTGLGGIVLTPAVARRLRQLLAALIEKHDAHHGHDAPH